MKFIHEKINNKFKFLWINNNNSIMFHMGDNNSTTNNNKEEGKSMDSL